MRVLLDECLPRRLKRELVGHDTRTAPEMGWASKSNGELLALAVDHFDVFLTADRNLSHQQGSNRWANNLRKSAPAMIAGASLSSFGGNFTPCAGFVVR